MSTASTVKCQCKRSTLTFSDSVFPVFQNRWKQNCWRWPKLMPKFHQMIHCPNMCSYFCECHNPLTASDSRRQKTKKKKIEKKTRITLYAFIIKSPNEPKANECESFVCRVLLFGLLFVNRPRQRLRGIVWINHNIQRCFAFSMRRNEYEKRTFCNINSEWSNGYGCVCYAHSREP